MIRWTGTTRRGTGMDAIYLHYDYKGQRIRKEVSGSVRHFLVVAYEGAKAIAVRVSESGRLFLMEAVTTFNAVAGVI